MIRGRTRLVALAVATVVVLLSAVFIVQQIRAHRAAANVAEQCRAVTAVAKRLPPPAAHPEVAVLGDSYAEGMELSDPGEAWPFQAFPSVAVDAVGGTGFTSEGPCGKQSFQQRAAHVVALGAPVIVIQGGLNDVSATPSAVRAAASKLLRSMSAGGTRVVLIGPARAPGRPAEAERAVDRALRQAAEDASVTYLSALSWSLDFGADGVHMTAASHAEFGREVASVVGRT